MKLPVIIMALTLGGCVSQSEFEAYKANQFEAMKSMAELHLRTSKIIVDHEQRLDTLQGRQNSARAY